MPQIGPLEIAVVLLIALLVFGPNRLPEMARQVGGAIRELRRIQQGISEDLHEMMSDESDGAAPPPTLPPRDGGQGEIIDVTGTEPPASPPPASPPPPSTDAD